MSGAFYSRLRIDRAESLVADRSLVTRFAIARSSSRVPDATVKTGGNGTHAPFPSPTANALAVGAIAFSIARAGLVHTGAQAHATVFPAVSNLTVAFALNTFSMFAAVVLAAVL